MVAPVPCALAIATSVSKQTNTCARRFAITISSVLYLTSLTGALHKNKKEAKILYSDDSGELGGKGPRALCRRGARGPHDRDGRARRLAHVLQYSRQMATPPARFSSATAYAAAYHRERLDYFVGRHAGYSLSRCGNGAPAGLSVSRPDRAYGVLRRARPPGDSAGERPASLTLARFRQRSSCR